MTVVPINPTAGVVVAGGGIDAVVARMASGIARLDQRIASLEANQTNIGAYSITSDQIGYQQVDGTHIAPASITTASIQAGAITAEVIDAVSIAAAVGTFISINAAQIVAGDITADRMTTNWLQAGQAAITSLSAITANMGAITAGNITGALIQTSASGSRVVMDSTGLKGYALDGATKTFEINTGTGIASFTGVANLDPASVIPGATIVPGSLDASTRLIAGSVTTLQIAAGAINTNQIAAGAVTAGKITVAFGSVNLAPNPGFEDGSVNPDVNVAIPGWSTVFNGALTQRQTTSAGDVRTGKSSLKITDPGTAGCSVSTSILPAVVPGERYTFSFYARGGAATRQVGAQITFRDASNVDLAPVTGETGFSATSIPTRVAGGWDRYVVTGTAPTGAANVYLTINIGAGGAANDFIFVDDVQLELGGVASPVQIYGTIGPTQITPNSITSDQIMANSIQAGDMTVGQLSAITADMGSIFAGTITGATVQSSLVGVGPSLYKASMDSAGFHFTGGASPGRGATSGVTLFNAGASGVTVRGTLVAEALDFIYSGSSLYAGGQTANWYFGNYQSLIASMTAASDGTYGYHHTKVRSNASGAVSEWAVACYDYTNTSNLTLLMQYAGSSSSLRLFSSGTTTWQLWYDGSIDQTNDIRMIGNATIWFSQSPYFRLKEDWGAHFDGGNYTQTSMGGSGTSLVMLNTSGTSTAGATYTLGWAYTLGYGSSSDERMKYDIRDVPEKAALSRVRALRPVRFAFKGGPGTGTNFQGFLAQDVQKYIPEAVERIITADGEETLALQPMAIISALVSAVQELSEAVNILRGEKPNAPLTRDNVKALR